VPHLHAFGCCLRSAIDAMISAEQCTMVRQRTGRQSGRRTGGRRPDRRSARSSVYMGTSAATARRPRGEQCWDVSRPSRSVCPSITFALLNHRVVLRLGTRFGASIGARTCSPAGLDSHDGCCTEPAGTSIRTAPAGHRVPGEYGYGPRRTRGRRTGEPAHPGQLPLVPGRHLLHGIVGDRRRGFASPGIGSALGPCAAHTVANAARPGPRAA
jgi:hypothetical protein